jgi:hypothetical protein
MIQHYVTLTHGRDICSAEGDGAELVRVFGQMVLVSGAMKLYSSVGDIPTQGVNMITFTEDGSKMFLRNLVICQQY